MFYTLALYQFKWDYMSERRPIDLLLAVGGNDLINHGLTGLSHGLREWASEIEHLRLSITHSPVACLSLLQFVLCLGIYY